jgi:hypothetical protein
MYQEIKNSPSFYQQAPFLTISEDLLKLIKEGKVSRLIFLSAYDKRKFPNGDERKIDIFKETFGKLDETNKEEFIVKEKKPFFRRKVALQLIGFDSEEKGMYKVD